MTAAAPKLLGELETNGPAHAPGGRIALGGWCFAQGQSVPPVMRLTVGGTILPMATRRERKDVAARLPGEMAARECGFIIEGNAAPGVHVAKLEAQRSDGAWECFRSFTLSVEAAPLAAAIEVPATRVARERVHVEGWALDTRQPVSALALRYGHQQIDCELGRPRADLGAIHAEAAHAARAGFKSTTILSAGAGPVRLRAILADGTVAVARTPLVVDIKSDENHDGRIDFQAQRAVLPRPSAKEASPRFSLPGRALNVLFVLPGSFAANSALHVAALANELVRAGHACTVAVSHDLETLQHHEAPLFRGCLHTGVSHAFADGRGPDLIQAWTTRENVRSVCEDLRNRHHARLIVHLEDNELALLAHAVKRKPAQLLAMSDAALAQLVPPDLSHPHRANKFLASADGITVITEALRQLVPPGPPVHVIQPAADARYFFPHAQPIELRRLLDRKPGETFLFYHGNVHAANAAEVRELYAAVLALNRAGQVVTLIRTGLDRVDFLGALATAVAPHVLELGLIRHHHHLPALMALADVFVQPGAPDAFNDYRFPSKLPEFFALGRPVILPRTNLGTRVRHGIDAYVLDRADAASIAAAITELRADPALHARLSAGAAEFASQHFSWSRSAEALANFYASLTASPASHS